MFKSQKKLRNRVDTIYKRRKELKFFCVSTSKWNVNIIIKMNNYNKSIESIDIIYINKLNLFYIE